MLHIPFIDNDQALSNRVTAAWLNAVNNLVGTYLTNVLDPDIGAVGNGTTNDGPALVTGISTGKSLLFPPGEYLCSNLPFDQSNVTYWGQGDATLLFGGDRLARLFTVTGSNVTFIGLTFSGSNAQVASALIYLSSNAQNVRFLNCTFKNISGNHFGGVSNNISNNQYAVLISPYGVTDFAFENCVFQDIRNDNSGVNVAAATGLGFCGGAMFITDDWVEPTAIQTNPTSGVFSGCTFKDIVTTLAGGLSASDQVNFNDADGIRFYGDGTGVGETKLFVEVSNCYFKDCSKRAVKGSIAAGVSVRDCVSFSTTALAYPMVTGIKADGENMLVDGFQIYSPPGQAVRQAIQTHNANYVQIHNVYVERCLEVWSIAPLSAAAALVGYRVSNIIAPDVEDLGIRVDVAPDSFTDWIIENVSITAKSGTLDLNALEFSVAALSVMDVTLKNVFIQGGDLKISGMGWTIEGLHQRMNIPSFTGSSSTAPLAEFGVSPPNFLYGASRLDDYFLEVVGLSNTWFTGPPRADLFTVMGKFIDVNNLRIQVPETMVTTSPTYSHGAFWGDDITVNGLTYSGKGQISWLHRFKASFGPYLRNTLQATTRKGLDGADVEFIYAGQGQRCTIAGVVDERAASAGTVNVTDGTVLAGDTHAWLIDGVQSATSSAGGAVYGAAVGTAIVTNTKKFDQTILTVASAAGITLPADGDVFSISGTVSITQVTPSWAGRRVTLVFADILTFTDGSNLVLAGNFVTTTNDSITLACDGTNWIESSRSIN